MQIASYWAAFIPAFGPFYPYIPDISLLSAVWTSLEERGVKAQLTP